VVNAREVAWRVFAAEYNASTLDVSGEGEKSPSYVVSPTGARINRLYVVGVVTDVENVGTANEPLYRARLSDPTGTFFLSAGQYQPTAAGILGKLRPPAFVAVMGKSRAYTAEGGGRFLSVRPEMVREVDAAIRDYWSYEACASLKQRLDCLEEAGEMNPPTVEGLVALGYPQALASGTILALSHYKEPQVERYRALLLETLRELVRSVGGAPLGRPGEPTKPGIEVVAAEEEALEAEPASLPEEEAAPSSDDAEAAVLQLIESLDRTGKGAPWEDLVAAAAKQGLEKTRLEEATAALLDKGEIYEPELGKMKRI